MAVGTVFVGVAGAVAGLGSFNSTPGDSHGLVIAIVVLRSVLVIALVTVMTWAFRVRDRRTVDHARRPSRQVLIVAGFAYVVNISSWGGHTLFGQLIVPAGVFSVLFDFVVWMAVAVAGVRLGDRARVTAKAAAVPYA
jgi:uncharacterized membrane protein